MIDLRELVADAENGRPDDAGDLPRRHQESLFPSVGL